MKEYILSKGQLKEKGITSFNAGWRTFTISFEPDLTEEEVKCWGKTDFDQAIIHLDDSMYGELLRETLLHEITHILLETVGYGDYDDGDHDRSHNNERLTILVSRAFLQAMNLNNELFSILL